MPLLFDEKLVAVTGALQQADLPHAVGGANALAYYGPPRATLDIDLNVFVPLARAREVLDVLGRLGADTADASLVGRVERDGQIRVFWERTPLDLFFSYDALHDSSMARRRRVDFGDDRIDILSAEDLMVYKLIFDRDKDWRDIADIIYVGNHSLDFDYVRSWSQRIVGASDPRMPRLQRLIDSGGKQLEG